MLRFKSLGSGSSGNATLVEAKSGAQTTRLLIDCGLRLRDLETRLEEAGTRIEALDAIFITHEHGDHIGCARSLVKRHNTPIWMSRGTWLAIQDPHWLPLQTWVKEVRDGQTLVCGELQISPFTVPHDAREPLQLRCTNGDRQLGVVTDLGHVTPHVVAALQGCHALLLESNHDPDMLQRSSYPNFLKQRVGGAWGHLANHAAADLLQQIKHSALNHVLAAHLSERNNTPELARACLSEVMGCMPLDIDVANPIGGSGWIDV
ncbi:MBL fold metallo-hydrolase [Limnohabitans sp.]|uniref:MBL fold metallo-hydrolase n=1 Tax=Limnohabitans sp. TaxID=1907725 RepID=UPI00286F249C|nr:MBL fold metallo-hydrolase [Limnohabitans sp.]